MLRSAQDAEDFEQKLVDEYALAMTVAGAHLGFAWTYTRDARWIASSSCSMVGTSAGPSGVR